jgi:branched-chain amino acid transport system permease protein
VSILVNVLVGGLAIGSVYAMMAIGFSLLWQTSRTINFAQGDFATVVGFVFVGLTVSLGFATGIAAGLAVIFAMAVLGWGVRKTVIAKLINHGVLSLVVATIALSILIQNLFVVFWTPQAVSAPGIISARVLHFAAVTVSVRDIVNLLVATVMIVALQAFLHLTRTGKALRATAQNAAVARVIGIDPGRMITLAFVINAALVAVAAILLAPIYLVQYNMGTALGLNAFYAAIIGGFNRVRGALVGGLVVGLLESISAAYISTAYQTGVVVAFLMAMLLIKPEGLLGEKELVREYQG